MARFLCQHNSDKASVESSSASLSSSLLKLETTTHEENRVSSSKDPKAQRQQIRMKDRMHRRCSSSSLTEQSSFVDYSPIPAFVYIPRAFSSRDDRHHDQQEEEEEEESSASSSAEDEAEIHVNVSHEFFQWQAFPNMSDIKHNAVWGMAVATVNDVIAEDEKLHMVCPKMEYWPSAESSLVRQPKPPLSHCSLSTSSLLVV